MKDILDTLKINTFIILFFLGMVSCKQTETVAQLKEINSKLESLEQ